MLLFTLEPAGIYVHSDKGFSMVYKNVSPAFQPDLPVLSFLNLRLDIELIKYRDLFIIKF